VMHEERQQDDYWQRDADEPKKQSSSKAHCILHRLGFFPASSTTKMPPSSIFSHRAINTSCLTTAGKAAKKRAATAAALF
jgi:hypothetical protein